MPDQPCMDSTLVESAEVLEWNNSDNNAFYESLQVDGLKAFASKAGLNSGCDVDALKSYWSKATSILEVGAGYGRVVEYLLKHGFQKKITAIERCNVLFKYLNSQFGKKENVRLLKMDVRYLNDIDEHFDLILVLWSFMCDFSPLEQPIIMQKLADLLAQGGKLIIDTIPPNVMPLEVTKIREQFYLLKANSLVKYNYEPNPAEITRYAQKAGLLNSRRISCRTETDRERWLYILS